jgi:hypothetical protein
VSAHHERIGITLSMERLARGTLSMIATSVILQAIYAAWKPPGVVLVVGGAFLFAAGLTVLDQIWPTRHGRPPVPEAGESR